MLTSLFSTPKFSFIVCFMLFVLSVCLCQSSPRITENYAVLLFSFGFAIMEGEAVREISGKDLWQFKPFCL